MAEPSKDTDQSMEDILQSIKRIIADEDQPADANSGSDVLELTELLSEDVSVKDAPILAPSTEMSIDDIMAAPMVADVPPAIEAAPVAPTPTPTASPAVTADALMSDMTLAASASALNAIIHSPSAPAAIGKSPAFRSGATVEDLVLEALRPMLKDWLDSNLPGLVQSLVEKEIRRLSA
jgi:uncharacterized protein